MLKNTVKYISMIIRNDVYLVALVALLAVVLFLSYVVGGFLMVNITIKLLFENAPSTTSEVIGFISLWAIVGYLKAGLLCFVDLIITEMMGFSKEKKREIEVHRG